MLHTERDVDWLISFTRFSITHGGARASPELYRHRVGSVSARSRAATSALREARTRTRHLPSWRDLAAQLAQAEDHEGRVEALTAIGRLSRDPLELRDVHLELARLHENEVPDAARAAAAYQRVLKLGPRNTQALEGLAALYRREGKQALAIETLTQLSRVATEPTQRRRSRCSWPLGRRAWGRARCRELLESCVAMRHRSRRCGSRGLLCAAKRPARGMHLNAASHLRHSLGKSR